MKKIIASLMIAGTLFVSGTTAFAADQTMGGITTEVISDNNQYSESDIAKVKVRVTNNSGVEVTNINAESILGEGLELTGESVTELSKAKLGANESAEYVLYVKKAEKVVPGEETTKESKEETTAESKEETTVESKEETTVSVEQKKETTVVAPAETTAAAKKTEVAGSSVKTGDSRNTFVIMLLTVLLISGGLYIGFKGKKSKKTISTMLCAALVIQCLQGVVVKADGGELVQYQVVKNLYFGDETFTIDTNVTFDKIQMDESKTYTRGEWADILMDVCGMSVEDIDRELVNWYFGDTKNSENGMKYEYLQALGILPQADNEGFEDPDQDVALFEADKLVTREYAAYTVVKALGYVNGEDTLQCEDAADTSYPAEMALAVKFDILTLQDNKLNPKSNISEKEKMEMVAYIKAADDLFKVNDDDEVREVTYNEGVIADELAEVKNYTVAAAEDGTLTVTVNQKIDVTLAEGNIIVLPENDQNEDGCIVKIANIAENDGVYTITGVEPTIEEVVNALYIKEHVDVTAADFVPEDGITVSTLDSEENASEEDVHPLDVELDTSFIKLNIEDEDSPVSLQFSVPTVTVVADAHLGWSGVGIDELALLCNTKAEVKIAKEWVANQNEEAGTEGWEKKLGTFKVSIGAGFKAKVAVYLYCDIRGNVNVSFAFESTQGIQYKNGTFRVKKPYDVTKSLYNFAAEANFEAGPKAKIGLDFLKWGLVSVDFKTGVAADASATLHTDANLLCVDANVYLPFTIELGKDDIMGKIFKKLNVSITIEVFNSDNSPFRKNFHLENFQIVNECTYAKGKFVINVVDKNGNKLNNVKVTYQKTGKNEVKSDFTNENGRLEIPGLDEGSYLITARATGYHKFETRESLRARETKYVETVLMVLRAGEEENGVIQGEIKDAVTGEKIDASYEVRKQSGTQTEAEVIASGTSENGSYSVELPDGYYTITFKKDQYYDLDVNVAVIGGTTVTKNVTISPILGDTSGEMRVVLTWGEYPYDLDSHLLSAANNTYHVYYSDKNQYREDEDGNTILVADLDTDDTDSYGPETITIHEISENDKFQYYVHDYTNRYNEENTQLSASEATVRVYMGNTLVATYHIPVDQTGTLWHVFDYDPETKQITAVNEFSYVEDHHAYFYNEQ